MAVYITGDTHGSINLSKLASKNIKNQIGKNDYLIICGDFGFIWDDSPSDKYWLKWITNKPWTTLFVDGNHENFERLYQYPKVNMFDGVVHEINNKIYHLMRGEIYKIERKSFFCMGGATSHDKETRRIHISWWEQEIPSYVEMEHGLLNLEKNQNTVDYIITHCLPTKVIYKLFPEYKSDNLTNYLDVIYDTVKYKKWFCGHYHTDKDYDKICILYNEIIKLEDYDG